MIIAELHGGLGNQLFQYASAKAIALKNDTDLKLDTVRFMHKTLPSMQPTEPVNTSDRGLKEGILNPVFKLGSKFKREFYSLYSKDHYKTDPKRVFELASFNIESCTLSTLDILKFHFTNRVLNKYKFVKEKADYTYDPEVLGLGKDCYLMGFWQTELYFKDISDQIRKEFKVKIAPSQKDAEMIDLINKTNSVSLHVRRGDYVSSSTHAKQHGSLSLEYYTNAIEYIKSKVENPHFFIFSDDPDWAKENIKTGTETTVSYNPPEVPYADIRLMYTCKHNIIANSTYSWWGAWLGSYDKKIVVAPKNWVANPEVIAKDAVPENWIRL